MIIFRVFLTFFLFFIINFENSFAQEKKTEPSKSTNTNIGVIDMQKILNESVAYQGVVEQFEEKIAKYVGAKYACSVNSATNAIFLSMLNKNTIVSIPSMIPPVVANAIITSGKRTIELRILFFSSFFIKFLQSFSLLFYRF